MQEMETTLDWLIWGPMTRKSTAWTVTQVVVLPPGMTRGIINTYNLRPGRVNTHHHTQLPEHSALD